MLTGLIAGGVVILSLVAWSIWLMRRGRDTEAADRLRLTAENARVAQKIREENARRSDLDVRDRLREQSRRNVRPDPADHSDPK